jgi:proteic killer suppression protein
MPGLATFLTIKEEEDAVPIKTFRDKRSLAIFRGAPCKGVEKSIRDRARTRMLYIDAAHSLSDLKALPGNRLEALNGDRKGQWSIRVNGQWRVCFEWKERDAYGVEFVDYH